MPKTFIQAVHQFNNGLGLVASRLEFRDDLKRGQTVLSELFDVLTGLKAKDAGDCPSNFEDALSKLCNEDSPPPMNCGIPD